MSIAIEIEIVIETRFQSKFHAIKETEPNEYAVLRE